MNLQWSISVVIPVYNEIELLDSSVRTISKFLCDNHLDHEIIIIESGSTDGSNVVCDRLAAVLPSVSVIHESQRNGMGAALRLGYAKASKDLVWLITVDLPFPLATLLEALPLMSKCDCVLSYRTEDTRSPFRKIQSWAYNRLVKSILGLPMRTVNSAFKLYRRDLLQKIQLTSNGWLLDAEVLYWVAHRKYRFLELPVPVLERAAGTSKVTSFDIFRTLRELIRFKRTLALNKAKHPTVACL